MAQPPGCARLNQNFPSFLCVCDPASKQSLFPFQSSSSTASPPNSQPLILSQPSCCSPEPPQAAGPTYSGSFQCLLFLLVFLFFLVFLLLLFLFQTTACQQLLSLLSDKFSVVVIAGVVPRGLAVSEVEVVDITSDILAAQQTQRDNMKDQHISSVRASSSLDKHKDMASFKGF